jgi:hypothetical protein
MHCLFLTANIIPLTEHLMRWNSNKDNLNGFALRIAGLKSDLGGLLSQQATQHPWQHADALAQIESRVVSNRGFYATLHDADEEVAKALSSKNGGGSDVQIVSCGVLSSYFTDVSGSRTAPSLNSWPERWGKVSSKALQAPSRG